MPHPGARVIRPAAPGDRPVVSALAVAAGMFPPEDFSVSDGLMADYFAGQRERGHGCLIDEEAGEVLGVAYFLPKPATNGTWELLMIAVRPDQQGQGRGSRLLDHMERELRAQGARLVLVETSGLPDYARTRAFYTRCGYHEEARVRDYYEPGADMVLFRKALLSPP